jgi:carboxyl-terminal processing protease
MRLTSLLIGCQLALALRLPGASLDDTLNALVSTRHTNVTPLVEAPDDTNIVKWVSFLTESSHYNSRPFTPEEISSKFLDRYLDALDPQHIYFTQADLADFEPFRQRLYLLTKHRGDSSPARLIFDRFRERLDQQVSYATSILTNETLDFTGDDRFLRNRRKEPRPKDLETARRLWRDRLRYEYLEEKLGMGRPDVIADIVLEKLNQKKSAEIPKALEDKVSKEKAEDIAKLVEAGLQRQDSPEALAQAVRAKLEKDNAAEIVKTLTRRYQRVLRMIRDYDNDDVLQVYLTALTHVYDPHSDYFGKSEFENFNIGMSLKLFGIGAVLSSQDGYCKIMEIKPGPAMRSGKLKVGDRIVAVAQGSQPPVDVVDMKLNKIVEMIRGPKDTEVRLTIIPADAPDPSVRQVVTLQRDEIKLDDQAAKARIIEVPVDSRQALRLGVIELPSFYSEMELTGRKKDGDGKSTTVDVAVLLAKLKREQVSGVILDLRRNGGGSLEEAIKLTGLFIKEGPVVQVKGSRGPAMVDKDTDPAVAYDGPLVVLTSRFSASASEILAGALQDYGRALIVGDSSTHGKGTVQSLMRLDPILQSNGVITEKSAGALKVTIRKFYRVTGSSTQLKGVTPDIVLPSVNNHLEVGEAALDNPMPWDTIAAADFDKLDLVSPHLDELKKRSVQRLAQDRDYAYIREDIERYKKAQADKTISLNEAQRLKEKQELDERAKARKKEIAARPPASETIYDITLELADKPGLPPPLGSTNEVKTASPALTNAQTVARASTPPAVHPGAEDDDTANAAKTPAVDPPLDEAKRILRDLISLAGKGNLVTLTQAPTAKK